MATRQIVPMICPACGGRFVAPLETIIDVSHDAKLKTRFLQGQANIATCPQCGDQGSKNAPALYHDAEHELALVLMPPELNLLNDIGMQNYGHAPRLPRTNPAARKMESGTQSQQAIGADQLHVAISDTDTWAVACVVFEALAAGPGG